MLSLKRNCLILHYRTTILNYNKITMYPVFHLTKYVHFLLNFTSFNNHEEVWEPFHMRDFKEAYHIATS